MAGFVRILSWNFNTSNSRPEEPGKLNWSLKIVEKSWKIHGKQLQCFGSWIVFSKIIENHGKVTKMKKYCQKLCTDSNTGLEQSIKELNKLD